jgi:hypothetical protein
MVQLIKQLIKQLIEQLIVQLIEQLNEQLIEQLFEQLIEHLIEHKIRSHFGTDYHKTPPPQTRPQLLEIPSTLPFVKVIMTLLSCCLHRRLAHYS